MLTTASISARLWSAHAFSGCWPSRWNSVWNGFGLSGTCSSRSPRPKLNGRVHQSIAYCVIFRRVFALLPPETERVWQFLKDQPALTGFVLVGGSALALRIKHRISEDLDLAYPEIQLPRDRLDSLLRTAAQSRLEFEHSDNEAALQEFLQGGMELRDYQQDFLANHAVKLSFFAPETPVLKVLNSPREPTVRIASLAELFKMKCLVS